MKIRGRKLLILPFHSSIEIVENIKVFEPPIKYLYTGHLKFFFSSFGKSWMNKKLFLLLFFVEDRYWYLVDGFRKYVHFSADPGWIQVCSVWRDIPEVSRFEVLLAKSVYKLSLFLSKLDVMLRNFIFNIWTISRLFVSIHIDLHSSIYN